MPSPVLAALLLLAAAACQGTGVPRDEIPADPIAIHYRDPETSRLRADVLKDEQMPRQSRDDLVANVDKVSSYMSKLLGNDDTERDFPGRLALLSPRTGEVELIASARSGAIPVDWSSDRNRLLYAQRISERFQLFELDTSSGAVRQVTRGPDAHPNGCYAGGGRLLLMRVDRRSRPPRPHIALTDFRGRRPRRVSPEGLAHSPACAPDGSSAAFVLADPRGRDQLYTVDVAGEGEARHVGPGRDPSFSPDSQWIAYSAPVQREWKLHRVRPDGSGRARVGKGALDERFPAYSPDGRLLIYVRTHSWSPQLYLRRLDGSGDRILFADGDVEHPIW